MAIPASLLSHIEQHGCFTGCYSSESDISLCVDPAKQLQPMVVVSCHDCFARFGAPRALLPANGSSYWLADQLSQHLRRQRGFTLSLSGYHSKGPGFWLGMAYYGNCGLFLLNGERSRSLGSDLDLLLLAFKNGVLPPPDARMVDPKLFTTQVVYVRFAPPISTIGNKQDLLASSHCRVQQTTGYQRVTLAEFLPLAAAAATGAAAPVAAGKKSPAGSTQAKQLKLGDICPKCGAEVRMRSLLQGTYVGCLC